MPKGLPPLSPAGPGQPIEHMRGNVLDLLSDDAKALVLGELADMRTRAVRDNGDKRPVLIDADMAIRRVARGLYRYELRRVDPSAPEIDFDVTTGRGAL